MSKLISFVRLDFHTIKPYKNSILIIIILGIGMGFGFKSASTLSSYFMMFLMVIMSYPFSIGDKNGLDTLYGTLPLNKKNIVAGRYLFVLMLEIIFVFLALLCSFALSVVCNLEFILSQELLVLCLCSVVFSIVVAIQYPIYFKLGYNKAKFIALIPLLAVFLIVIQLPMLVKLFNLNFSLEVLFANIAEKPLLMCLIFVATGLFVLAISCKISQKFYIKRDI